MKMSERARISRFFTGLFLLCLFTVGIFPVFVGNYTEFTFRGRSGDSNGLSSAMVLTEYNQQVHNYVSLAAVHFLLAKSKFDDTMQIIESNSVKDQINFSKFNLTVSNCVPLYPSPQKICENIECAINSINEAINFYALLVNLTDIEPTDPAYNDVYNIDVVNILKIFPTLEFFATNPRTPPGTNDLICQDIATLLTNGDVNGIYQTLLSHSQELHLQLITLKEYLNCSSLLPDSNIIDQWENDSIIIHQLWSINSEFTWTHMFGQYVSEVFYYIKNNYGDIGPGHWNLEKINHNGMNPAKIAIIKSR